jgi:hypothetical protein
MAPMTKWLAACCLLAFGNTATAQENTARPIPEGFVLPGPPPINAPAGATLPGESTAPAPSAPPPGAPAPAAPGTPPTVSGSNVATQNTVLPTAGAVQILGAGTGGKHQWPCVQRKVEHVDAGQVWPGPPLDEAEKVPRTEAMRQFVASVAARRVPLPEAVRTAADFVKALPEDQRAPTATAAFADLLQMMNSERLQIMRGIERYGAHQQALADKLRQENTTLSDLRARGDAKAADAQEALLWDTRVFEERRRSLTYVCEVPTLIEQRLFALGRAMSGAL